MFGEDLHDAAVSVQVLVHREGLCLPGFATGLVDGFEPVGGCLVGPDQAEVTAAGGVLHDPFQEVAQDTGGLVLGGARLVYGDGEAVEGRNRQIAHETAAVGVQRGAEAAVPLGDARKDVRAGPPRWIEEFLGSVRA